MPRRVALLVALLAAATVTACNVSTNEEPVAVEGAFDRVVQSTTTSTTTAPPAGARPVQVYFLRDVGGVVELEPAEREIEADAGVQEALEHLIPRTPPTEPGLSTAIPDSAVLIEMSSDEGILVVNTQGLFGQTGVQNPQLRRALGQIVCTATEFASVEAVLFQNEGRAVTASIEDGDVDRAVDCDDYDELS